jgi:hypothetical protein
VTAGSVSLFHALSNSLPFAVGLGFEKAVGPLAASQVRAVEQFESDALPRAERPAGADCRGLRSDIARLPSHETGFVAGPGSVLFVRRPGIPINNPRLSDFCFLTNTSLSGANIE